MGPFDRNNGTTLLDEIAVDGPEGRIMADDDGDKIVVGAGRCESTLADSKAWKSPHESFIWDELFFGASSTCEGSCDGFATVSKNGVCGVRASVQLGGADVADEFNRGSGAVAPGGTGDKRSCDLATTGGSSSAGIELHENLFESSLPAAVAATEERLVCLDLGGSMG